MSGDAKQRLARLLGELDRGAETPAGEFDPDDADYPLSETSSIELTESDAEDARARRAEKLPGGVMAGRLESKVQARTAKLEERLAVLMEENAKKDAATAEALAKQAKSFGEERAKMMEAVQLLKDKQSELERLAPPLREAVQGAKDQLRSVVCSQERLKELQAQDPSALSLADFVILRVHQETANLRADLDVTRVERDTSRDALGRLELDNKRLAREAKRASEYISQSDKEGEAERAALDSRCDRLTRELEDAMVKVEVLSAKGAMYDEVASTVDRLGKRCAEAEKDLAVAKGQEQLLREERDGLASKLASRQHQVDLLSQDKAYLTREVDALADRERKREEEEDRLREKARALRVSRDALQEKVLSGNAEFRSQHEERLNAEVARLQQKAAEDLERLREEHASARDREIRALRDLRDAAVADSVAARAELNDLRGAYDDLLAQHRASQTRADVARAEITGQLRMKAMELERVSMLHGESQSVAKVLRLECETLTKKVRLLESQYLGLEASAARRRAEADARSAEQAARLEHYESLERELDDAVMPPRAPSTTPAPPPGRTTRTRRRGRRPRTTTLSCARRIPSPPRWALWARACRRASGAGWRRTSRSGGGATSSSGCSARRTRSATRRRRGRRRWRGRSGARIARHTTRRSRTTTSSNASRRRRRRRTRRGGRSARRRGGWATPRRGRTGRGRRRTRSGRT